jgi:hypothetical protein
MSQAVEHFMDLENDALRKRLGRFLEQQYPGDRACRLSRDIDCDPRTAQNILNCHWPNARHMRAIVRRFGRDLIEAVFAPEIEPTLARLTIEEREAEERLEQIRARRRQAAGCAEGRSFAVAANEDGAAVTAAPKRGARP